MVPITTVHPSRASRVSIRGGMLTRSGTVTSRYHSAAKLSAGLPLVGWLAKTRICPDVMRPFCGRLFWKTRKPGR